jgi:hypothetical protein
MEEEDDRVVAVSRKHLQGLHERRKTVQAELDALATSKDRQDLEEGVDAAVAKLERLLEVLRTGKPSEVRATFQEAISRIELFFDRRPRGSGKQLRSTFVKAIVHVRENIGVTKWLTASNRCSKTIGCSSA